MSNETEALARALREGRLALAEVAGITTGELDAIFETAAMRMDLGRADEAARMLGALVVLYPFGAEYWRAYAVALSAIGNTEAAERARAMAVAIEPVAEQHEPTVTSATAETTSPLITNTSPLIERDPTQPTTTQPSPQLSPQRLSPVVSQPRVATPPAETTQKTATHALTPSWRGSTTTTAPPEQSPEVEDASRDGAPGADYAPARAEPTQPTALHGKRPAADAPQRLPRGGAEVRPRPTRSSSPAAADRTTWPSDAEDIIERPRKERTVTAVIDSYRAHDAQEEARLERRMRIRDAAGFDPHDENLTAIIRRRAGLPPLGDA